MPHITIEYSANLEGLADVPDMVRRAHRAVIACGAFDLAAIRTRAERRDIYEIADGDPANAFVNVTVRMAPGRTVELRRQLSQGLLDAVSEALGADAETGPFAVSVEVQEIDNSAMLRRNNLHQLLKGKGAAG